ncbi:MAG: peptidase T [Lachnospiraceae bacterium]|nr:peptidase T [Lachnospiraceae bacterium]
MSSVTERFLRYISIDTQSSEDSGKSPSTDKQHDLARVLYEELLQLGAADVTYDKEHCYIYAKIPATCNVKGQKTVGFISHMDTSPETSGQGVKARIIENYDGEDITLNASQGIVLKVDTYPEIKDYVGQSLIVTDGTTLLGADDKAGVAEIMTLAEHLLTHPEIQHGPIAVAFTPDEEIGNGTEYFDIKKFDADFAYTVDGGALGELEYETFNAASAEVTIRGVNVHTGSAKGVMINAARIGAEFDQLLPAEERPEFTEGREGFFHLGSIEGGVEEARLSYLIRDHDRSIFEKRKGLMLEAAKKLNLKYGEGVVSVSIEDSYYNMREKIEPDFLFLVEKASEVMKELGIEPKIQPVRGGTDGSRLSFMGLPCPNLFTGGHNFHGRYEYCCVESMEKSVAVLIKLAESFAE